MTDARPKPDGPAATGARPKRDGSAAELLRATLAKQVERLRRQDQPIRAGDPEGVHQARVALRRLRSLVGTFAPLAEEAWVRELDAEIAELAGPFGPARDADVLYARFQDQLWWLPAEDQLAAERLLDQLRRDRERAHATLLRTLASASYASLLAKLEATAREPILSSLAQEPADTLVPVLVRRRWRAVRRAQRALSEPPSNEELHRLRKRIKHCRYAAEAAVSVAGPRAARFAAALREVQELLGEHQDACVAQAWLRAHGERADERFVAGQLHRHEEDAIARTHRAWPRAWKKLRKKKLQSWFLN